MYNKRFSIGKIEISRINLEYTLTFLEESLQNNSFGYICVTNSRTTYLANKYPDYCQIQNNSLLTVPDGAPLVWIARNKGFKEVGKVSGKDLMEALFEASYEKGYSHYFYGSTPTVIAKLRQNLENKYPDISIKGAVSPPFQPLEDFNLNELAIEINKLEPTFFWCGLGAPKQERFIALLQPKLKKTICIGVGLAFEYFAGTINRAPKWMQNAGMEWLSRLYQQPGNIKRALIPLSWIFAQVLLSAFNRIK